MDGDEREVVAQAVLQRDFLGLLRGGLVVGPDIAVGGRFSALPI